MEPLYVALAAAAAGVIGLWVARRRGLGWKHRAVCGGCGRSTIQVRHGYTLDGTLWKGHVCLCGGWECSECRHLNRCRRECCR